MDNFDRLVWLVRQWTLVLAAYIAGFLILHPINWIDPTVLPTWGIHIGWFSPWDWDWRGLFEDVIRSLKHLLDLATAGSSFLYLR